MAQDDGEMAQPVYLTARLFVAYAPRDQGSLTDQLFRMRTTALHEDADWERNLAKAYPGTEIGILRTQNMRLFMVPKPGIVTIGKPDQPHIELQVLVAQGLKEDDSVVTTAIVETLFYKAKGINQVPLSMGHNGFNIELGMTYFYTMDELRLSRDNYTAYFRGGGSAPSLEKYDPYIIVAITHEAQKHPALAFDEKKSLNLQNKAIKKVEPQWSERIRKQNLSGTIQTKIEIGADGKVTKANVWQSTMPEGNTDALAAARQWEFPVADLTGINPPVSALLTFTLNPSKPTTADLNRLQEGQTTKDNAAKPAGKIEPAVKKSPVKRRKS